MPGTCVALRGTEVETVNVRRVGELGSTGVVGVGREREPEETAELERACLLLRGVVTLSNLVERPTVDNEDGSWEGR